MMGFVLRSQKLDFGTKKLCKFGYELRVIIETSEGRINYSINKDYEKAKANYDSITNDTKVKWEYNISVYDSFDNGEEIASCETLEEAEQQFNDSYNTYKNDDRYYQIELSKTPYVDEEIQDGMEVIYCWDLQEESKEGE